MKNIKKRISMLFATALLAVTGLGVAAVVTAPAAHAYSYKYCYVNLDGYSTWFRVEKWKNATGTYTWRFGGQDRYVDMWYGPDLYFDYYGAYDRTNGWWYSGTTHHYSNANGAARTFEGFFTIDRYGRGYQQCKITL